MKIPKLAVEPWIRSGAPWVWLNAAAVSTSILLVAGLLLLIAARGMGHFWPAAVHEIVYQEADGCAQPRWPARFATASDVKASRLVESGLQVRSRRRDGRAHPAENRQPRPERHRIFAGSGTLRSADRPSP